MPASRHTPSAAIALEGSAFPIFIFFFYSDLLLCGAAGTLKALSRHFLNSDANMVEKRQSCPLV